MAVGISGTEREPCVCREKLRLGGSWEKLCSGGRQGMGLQPGEPRSATYAGGAGQKLFSGHGYPQIMGIIGRSAGCLLKGEYPGVFPERGRAWKGVLRKGAAFADGEGQGTFFAASMPEIPGTHRESCTIVRFSSAGARRKCGKGAVKSMIPRRKPERGPRMCSLCGKESPLIRPCCRVVCLFFPSVCFFEALLRGALPVHKRNMSPPRAFSPCGAQG